MFYTVIQPTGVYGSFRPGWANDNNKQAFSKFNIQNPATEALKNDTNESIPKKEKSAASKVASWMLFGTLGAFAIIAGVPALRDKFNCFSSKELEKPAKAIFGSRKLGEIAKTARQKYVDSANFIENKFQVPLREFLYENVFKFVDFYPEHKGKH